MARAGASARGKYERLRAREIEQRKRATPQALALLVIGTPIVFALTRYGGPWALDVFFDSMASNVPAAPTATPAAPRPEQLIETDTAKLLGYSVSGLWMMFVLTNWLGRRRSTEAWRIGAEGEEATAAALEKLPATWTVLHDLRMPRSKANLDHVLVGPGGVVVVETKNYSSDVAIKDGELWRGGRRANGWLEQVGRQRAAVEDVLARKGHQAQTRAVILVHGGVSLQMFQRPQIGDVVIGGAKTVRTFVESLPAKLEPDEVAAIVATLNRSLHRDRVRGRVPAPAIPTPTPISTSAPTPAPPPASCGCGGMPTLRRRQVDGAPFYGCSSYPSCRNTWPASPGGAGLRGC